MAPRDNAAVVQSLYEGFNARDLDRVLASVTDDFELSDVATGKTFHGPSGFQEWLTTWLQGMPDAQTEVLNVIVAGDWVVSEHRGRGTHTGPLTSSEGTIEPTGRSIELQFAEFFLMREGKVA